MYAILEFAAIYGGIVLTGVYFALRAERVG